MKLFTTSRIAPSLTLTCLLCFLLIFSFVCWQYVAAIYQQVGDSVVYSLSRAESRLLINN